MLMGRTNDGVSRSNVCTYLFSLIIGIFHSSLHLLFEQVERVASWVLYRLIRLLFRQHRTVWLQWLLPVGGLA